ncbi:superinfection immunity protein [Nocardioides alkalitolerans]|uniref:superinfection immunity protein n=1 Tax=Nocardioides alkalitolerans TaxID=281714 RepID=UPI00041628CB|nr:superinfection immunity protein [Nocardioides alkalitolerans]
MQQHFVTDRQSRPISVTISIVLAIITLGYMLPWMIASMRGKSNAGGVFFVNLLVGWTIIGWIAALVMACTSHQVVGFRR